MASSASLYVGDLVPEITEALLFEIFSKVGPVASIRVCRDKVTRRSLGYAYVNFHAVADAERALDTLNFTSVKGKPCRIMWSSRDPSSRKSGKGNIFIKNLDPSIDNKMLYDTFSSFGSILSCKVMTDKEAQSLGYGFVHYQDESGATEAIASLNGMLLNGKQVYVGLFIPRKDRNRSAEDSFTNVYVKNLPEGLDGDGLTELFKVYGEVTSTTVMTDATGKSRGFGFVNFADAAHAKTAVDELNGKDVGGKIIYAGRAMKRAEREAKMRERKQERMNKYQGRNLYVKNLDETIDDDKLRQFFTEFNFGTITSARVMFDENGNSKGFGFVCYSTPEEATRAVSEVNGRILGSKPLYVGLAQRKQERKVQLEQHYAQRLQAMQARQPGMPGMPGPGFPQAPFYGMPPMVPQGRGGNVPFRGPVPPQGPRWAGPPGGNYGGPQPGGQWPELGQQQPPHAGGAGGRGDFQFRDAARNQNRDASRQPPAPAAAAPAGQSLEETKRQLGDQLYPRVAAIESVRAGKITGMLLELDPEELNALLSSPAQLNDKVREAIDVLDKAGGQ
jgi:polyadenylate-binding protein